MKSAICMIIYIIIHEKGKINFLLFYFLARYMRIEKCTGNEKGGELFEKSNISFSWRII